MRYRRRGSFEVCSKCQGNERVRQWKQNNPERAKEINTQPTLEQKKAYARSERGKQKSREKAARFYWKDIDATRERRRQFYLNNRDKEIQKVVRRSKRVLRATPKWANQDEIAKIYSESRRLTMKTGILHHVDHIIPLRGRMVSGLHVEGNLRVIPAIENQQKYNHFDGNA